MFDDNYSLAVATPTLFLLCFFPQYENNFAQKITLAKVDRGQIGSTEVTGPICGKIENTRIMLSNKLQWTSGDSANLG